MLGRRQWWEIFMPWMNPYSDRRVRQRGRKDGIAQPPIPAWDADFLPPFLRMLCQAGNQDVRALAKEWHDEDRQLKTDWALASHALDAAEEVASEAKARAGEALEEFEKAQGHRLVLTPSRLGYRLLIFTLCVFELPLNAFVFRGFGESEVFTWLLASGLGFVLTLCGHLLGRFLRETRSVVRFWLSGVVIALPCAAIASLAALRAGYLTHKASLASAFSPGLVIPFFIALNLIYYAVATILSYRHHEPFQAEVAHTVHKLRRAEYTRATSEATLEEAAVKREKRFLEKQEHAVWIAEEVKRLGSAYWNANLLARKDMGQHPSSFPKAYYTELEVTIPQELTTLTWDQSPASRQRSKQPPQERLAPIQMPSRAATVSTNEWKREDREEPRKEVVK